MSAPEAGNTVESLKPVDVNEAAAAQRAESESPVADAPAPEDATPAEVVAPDAEHEAIETPATEDVDKEAEITAAAAAALDADPELKAEVEQEHEEEYDEDEDEDEDEEYVTRAEFDDLLTRIANFNSRSGHQI